MKLIIGLGNPGKKYLKTRHNVGFLIVDYIQKKVNNFTVWQLKKELLSKIAHNKDRNIVLAKPQVFMNNSGLAVLKLIKNLKVTNSSKIKTGIENCIVIHDDFDLLLGTYKIAKGRGSAGHKGVQSIIDYLGTKNFLRLRIGIRPKEILSPSFSMLLSKKNKLKAENFVLKDFSKEELKILNSTIVKAVAELFQVLSI